MLVFSKLLFLLLIYLRHALKRLMPLVDVVLEHLDLLSHDFLGKFKILEPELHALDGRPSFPGGVHELGVEEVRVG